ncbi:MAG: hypothetical protein ACK5X3_20760 [Pseudomonadota bacterium]
MIAFTLISAELDLAAVAAMAGNAAPEDRWYSEGRLYVRGVTQAALDQAAVNAPPPPPPPPPTDVSFWQFMMAAWKLNFITHADALAAVRQRIMPPAFAQAMADLPAEAKLDAELKFAGITRMLRSDPLFGLVVEANIATDEQIDGVFAVAAAIT